MTASVASAVERTPVEIWSRIFELYLGPSLLANPDKRMMSGWRKMYEANTLLQDYIDAERQKNILRLVCHSWKRLADTLGDRFVVSHLDEHDWPPGRSKQNADYISYHIYSPWLEYELVGNYGSRVGAQEWKDWNSQPFKVTPHLPFAPYTSFVGHSFDISDLDSTVEPANVQFLSIGIRSDVFHHLALPLFHNVLFLDLFVIYPFKDSGTNMKRMLPNLDCLLLRVRLQDRPLSPSVTLSGWYFPKLSRFEFSTEYESGVSSAVSKDLGDFVQKHISLQHINLPYDVWDQQGKFIDWQHHIRLESMELVNLSSLPDILPPLRPHLASQVNKDGTRSPFITIKLRIHLREEPPRALVARLLPHHDLLANVVLLMEHSWFQLLMGFDGAINRILSRSHIIDTAAWIYHIRRKRADMFIVIEEAQLNVVDPDGNTADCDAARALRALAFQDQDFDSTVEFSELHASPLEI